MDKKKLKSNISEVLKYLLKDPTRSIRDIANEMSSYRQKVWREKKKLEEDHIIWGYTAVVDWGKIDHMSYIVLLKTKPMSRGLVDLLTRRLVEEEPRKQNVLLMNFCYVNGEYDWVMRFSAPNHATARKYYDTLRLLYDEYLLEKPIMVDLNFCLVAEGKVNPELRHLYDFIPG